jgi:hypothetical protein
MTAWTRRSSRVPGYGVAESERPRAARLGFDEACKIL